MNPTASSRPSAYVRPAALDGRHFSTVIIGAGINGVGVFRDLSLQGVDCLVVDKGDIASGASSAPSRMIHGGLRYLEHGSFALVAEATHERNLLLRNAPHLVRPLKTVVPLSNRFGGFMAPCAFWAPGAPAASAASTWSRSDCACTTCSGAANGSCPTTASRALPRTTSGCCDPVCAGPPSSSMHGSAIRSG